MPTYNKYYKGFIRRDIIDADNACKDLNGYEKQWFKRLLDLLIIGNVVRITVNGIPVDVTKVAYTNRYASFFDIINHRYFELDYNKFPFPVECECYTWFYLIKRINNINNCE